MYQFVIPIMCRCRHGNTKFKYGDADISNGVAEI